MRHSCDCVGLSRSAFYVEPIDWQIRDGAVIEALNGLAAEFPRLGLWKYVDVLRTRGYGWNPKRIHRVYCSLGLNQPRRTKRRLLQRQTEPLLVPQRANQVWSADFMSDALYHDPPF